MAMRWLRGQRQGVSLRELARYVAAPTGAARGREFVTGMEETGDWLKITLRGISDPLYYPRQCSRRQLFQTIAEICDPHEWHCYEVEGTKVSPDDTVVDCGAAEGLFALVVAQRCRTVYAVEPHPMFVESMERTFEGLDNVEVIPAALAEHEGTGYLVDAGLASSISQSGQGAPVRLTTLDALFPDAPITYIKADLEGHELAVLRGAQTLVQRRRPKIAITTYHEKGHADEIEAFLHRLVPEYRIRRRGIDHITGDPVMLHAWVD